MTIEHTTAPPTKRKQGRPRKSPGGRHLVSGRLTTERYEAAAQNNKLSISEEVEHHISESFRTDELREEAGFAAHFLDQVALSQTAGSA
jgi:hypothetical protein